MRQVNLPTAYFRIIIACFCSLIVCSVTITVTFAADNDVSSSFQTGIEAYEAGDYITAKSEFLAALEMNETAAARHNIGLTEYQMDNPTEAVWQLERALFLEPFNQDYRKKLNLVRAQLGLPENATNWHYWFSHAFSVEVWLMVATVSFWLLIVTLILPTLNEKSAGSRIKLLRFFSMLILALSLTAIGLNRIYLKTGTVLSKDEVSLHAAPATAAPEIGFARPGERAQILDRYSDFYRVKTEGSATGWISKNAFRPLVN